MTHHHRPARAPRLIACPCCGGEHTGADCFCAACVSQHGRCIEAQCVVWMERKAAAG